MMKQFLTLLVIISASTSAATLDEFTCRVKWLQDGLSKPRVTEFRTFAKRDPVASRQENTQETLGEFEFKSQGNNIDVNVSLSYIHRLKKENEKIKASQYSCFSFTVCDQGDYSCSAQSCLIPDVEYAWNEVYYDEVGQVALFDHEALEGEITVGDHAGSEYVTISCEHKATTSL